MKKILLILISIIIISCSNDSTELITLTIDNNLYTIKLDGDMNRMREQDANEDASLQYANIFKEKYIMIISEGSYYMDNVWNNVDSLNVYGFDTTISSFENYVNLLIEGLEYKFQSEANVSECSINGEFAKKAQIDGFFNGYDISWTSFLIKGQHDFFQICVWTTLNNKLDNLSELEKMAKTFKEI